MRNFRIIFGTVIAGLAMAGAASAQTAVPSLSDLVGARASGAEYQMQQRGYTHIRTDKSGNDSYSFWQEQENGQCVVVRTYQGRYQSITYAPPVDCKREGRHSGGGNWGGGGSHERGVILHRDLNYTGVSETFTNDVPDMRKTRFGDDHATSVSIGRGCTARLYRDLDFRGSYTEVTSDIGDLRGSKVGDDSVTSLQVRCGGGGGWGSGDSWGGDDEWGDSGGSKPYGVTLHRDLNYTGVSETFTSDVPDLRKTRVGDDHTTSVSVSRHCRARLYEHLNFEGAYTEVSSDIGDLRGSRVGNDSATSLRVRCDR